MTANVNVTASVHHLVRCQCSAVVDDAESASGTLMGDALMKSAWPSTAIGASERRLSVDLAVTRWPSDDARTESGSEAGAARQGTAEPETASAASSPRFGSWSLAAIVATFTSSLGYAITTQPFYPSAPFAR